MKIKGFTLLELLVILVLISGLALYCLTSFSGFTRKNEQQIILDEITAAVQYAKMQALTLGHPVYLTPLDPSLNWSRGIVLTHFNIKSNKMEPLYQWQWNYHNWNVNWFGIHLSKKITVSNNPVNAISNGKFIIANASSGERVTIILNRLGRMKSVKSRT